MSTDVVVVGGGVAGAAAAVALGMQGLRVVLLDQNRGQDLNRGDNLWPAALPLLQEWGALSRLTAAGALSAGGLEFRRPGGERLLGIDLDRLAPPHNYMINLPHGQIVDSMLEAARTAGVDVRLGPRVRGLLWEEGRVAGVLLPDGELRAALVVGADGTHSGLRQEVGIGTRTELYDFAYMVLHGAMPSAMPRPLRTISQLTPEGVVVLIPLPDERIRVVIAVPAAQVGAWRALSLDEVRQRVAPRQPLLAAVELESKGEHFYRLMRQHAERYTTPGLALVGDAAHVVAPFTGQGMNLAISDAAELARHVAGPLRAGVALDGALAAYEQVRYRANEATMQSAHVLAPLTLPGTPEAFWVALQAFESRVPPGTERREYEMQLVRVTAGQV